ncbi:Similar to S.cerevisiae protein ERG24 (C-14 sterol reductase) [Malassezia sympodialis ATCC 42132]|uniref:Delta(14)-sterol reductase ERG24 n=1 Tax=Malassezia sympodialis (strain ATCC 42132) TaxID=1230383 RepID=A0A1M8A478_MALS4|nr:Similar to S.cerevisiae protein ERG24 (C-14 sterol reductase) [Malassezia sympodialis ATCC 42132]
MPPKPAHSKEVLAPRSKELEFGGFFGALFVTVTVPLTMYYLAFGCSEELGCDLSLPISRPDALWEFARTSFIASFTDKRAWAIYYGWYVYCVIAWFVLPGKWVQGLPLRTGATLEYKINAFSTGALALGVAVGVIVKRPDVFSILYDHWPGLLTAAFVNSLVQAFFVYAGSFTGNKLLALGGNSGNPLFDWFIGRELNPRIGKFDIKTFNELRPGLLLWVFLDLSCACHQWKTFGEVSDSMILVTIFHSWYVVDSLLHESTILTQMDITTDGFGFMLSVGDLAWLPFTYSLQARYLAFSPVKLGWMGIVAVLAVQSVGYYIFRTSNVEKNDFRHGKNPKNLQYMTTSTGSKLLVSGWWGRSRHPNYLGDWIMAWAWCLPCGFSTPIPYFYVVYFAVLLVHRQLRDDDACKKKYGSDWDTYCKRVPYRIIPYVY